MKTNCAWNHSIGDGRRDSNAAVGKLLQQQAMSENPLAGKFSNPQLPQVPLTGGANPLDLPCQTVCWVPQATKATALWSFRWGADSFAGKAGVRCQQTRAAPSTNVEVVVGEPGVAETSVQLKANYEPQEQTTKCQYSKCYITACRRYR